MQFLFIMKNRNLIFFAGLTLFAVGFSCRGPEPENLQLSNLRCEMLADPEGIDAKNPRLSWEISGDKRGIVQTAYQVLVASSREKLKANEGDLWNSGKVQSD